MYSVELSLEEWNLTVQNRLAKGVQSVSLKNNMV